MPRPDDPLRIWLGSGGSPESVLRAVELGLPLFLGILGGTDEDWAEYGHAYRAAWTRAGHPDDQADIAVAVHGFVAADDHDAKATYLGHETAPSNGHGRDRPPGAPPVGRETDYRPGGMVFVG